MDRYHVGFRELCPDGRGLWWEVAEKRMEKDIGEKPKCVEAGRKGKNYPRHEL